MRDGVREAGRNVRGLGVFRLVKRCVCTFFFFFWILAWLGRYRPIRTESARFWPRRRRFPLRRRRFQPRRPDSGLATWHDAARTRGLRHPCRVAASRRVGRGYAGLGAAFVHPRWRYLWIYCQISCQIRKSLYCFWVLNCFFNLVFFIKMNIIFFFFF